MTPLSPCVCVNSLRNLHKPTHISPRQPPTPNIIPSHRSRTPFSTPVTPRRIHTQSDNISQEAAKISPDTDEQDKLGKRKLSNGGLPFSPKRTMTVSSPKDNAKYAHRYHDDTALRQSAYSVPPSLQLTPAALRGFAYSLHNHTHIYATLPHS